MTQSIYGVILDEMLRELPDGISAVFADWEGEAVDNAGETRVTDIRLAGAHWGIIYYLTRDVLSGVGHGTPQDLVMRFADRLYVVRQITSHYYVVLESRGDALLARALRALDRTRARLLEQM